MNIQQNIVNDLFSLSLKTDLKNGSCPYLVKYSLDVLNKKTKVLDIFNTDKNCLMKINIEIKSSRDIDRDPFSQQIRIPITANNP